MNRDRFEQLLASMIVAAVTGVAVLQWQAEAPPRVVYQTLPAATLGAGDLQLASLATPVIDLASPGPIGATTPAAIAGTSGTFSGTVSSSAISTTNVTLGSSGVIAFGATRSRLASAANGYISLTNAAGTDFTGLRLGGTTSSFPMLKRSGTGLVSRLADDSANAAFACAGLTATTISGTNIADAGGGITAITFPVDGTLEFLSDASPYLTLNAETSSVTTAGSLTAGGPISGPSLTASPASNATGLTLSGYSVTGSGTTPAVALSGTVNSSGNAAFIKGTLTLTSVASSGGGFYIQDYVTSGGTPIYSLGVTTTAGEGTVFVNRLSARRDNSYGTINFGGSTGDPNASLASGWTVRSSHVYGWASGTNTTAGYDTNLSRSSAGVVQVGTSAANASGTIAFTNSNVSGYDQFTEISDPSAGAANTARLYCKDNGSGKTQLCVRFNSGAVQVIATEP